MTSLYDFSILEDEDDDYYMPGVSLPGEGEYSGLFSAIQSSMAPPPPEEADPFTGSQYANTPGLPSMPEYGGTYESPATPYGASGIPAGYFPQQAYIAPPPPEEYDQPNLLSQAQANRMGQSALGKGFTNTLQGAYNAFTTPIEPLQDAQDFVERIMSIGPSGFSGGMYTNPETVGGAYKAAIPATVGEVGLELLPGIGTVPGVASAIGKNWDEVVTPLARAAMPESAGLTAARYGMGVPAGDDELMRLMEETLKMGDTPAARAAFKGEAEQLGQQIAADAAAKSDLYRETELLTKRAAAMSGETPAALRPAAKGRVRESLKPVSGSDPTLSGVVSPPASAAQPDTGVMGAAPASSPPGAPPPSPSDAARARYNQVLQETGDPAAATRAARSAAVGQTKVNRVLALPPSNQPVDPFEGLVDEPKGLRMPGAAPKPAPGTPQNFGAGVPSGPKMSPEVKTAAGTESAVHGPLDFISELGNASKRLTAMGDIGGAGFRQNLPTAFIDPKVWGTNLKRGVRAYFEDPQAAGVMEEIAKLPRFAKGSQVTVGGKRVGIPSMKKVLGIGDDFQTPGFEKLKKPGLLSRIVDNVPLQARSEKAQRAILVGTATDLRNGMIDAAVKSGNADPSWFNHYGDIAKVATGYGDVPKTLKGLSDGFYSLRNTAARFQTFTQPVTKPGQVFRSPPAMLRDKAIFSASPRGVATKNLVRFAASETANLKFLAAAGALTGAFEVGADPLSAGFGRLTGQDEKGNDYSVDLLGGFGGLVKAVFKTGAAAYDASQGRTSAYDPVMEWQQFFRYKMAGVPSTILDSIIEASPALRDTMRSPFAKPIQNMGLNTDTLNTLIQSFTPFAVGSTLEPFFKGTLDFRSPNDLFKAGATLLTSMATGVTDIFPPSTGEQASLTKDQVSREKFGKGYRDVPEAQQQQVDADPRVAKKTDQALQERASTGDILARNKLASQSDRKAAMEGGESNGLNFGEGARGIDNRLAEKELTGEEARKAYDEMQEKLAIAASVRANTPEAKREIEQLERRKRELTPPEQAQLDYYAIFDGEVYDKQGNLDFDAYRKALDEWEIKHPGYSKEDVSPSKSLSPGHAQLQEARKQLSPYFAIEDEAWKKAQAADKDYAGYSTPEAYIRAQVKAGESEDMIRALVNADMVDAKIDKMLYLFDHEDAIPLLRKWYSVPGGIAVLDPTYLDELVAR